MEGASITSPNSTITIGGLITATTVDVVGAAGELLAGSTPALTATPTLGVQNTTAGQLTLAGSASVTGKLTLGIAGASANGATLVPGADAGAIYSNTPRYY